MDSDELSSADTGESFFRNPWPALCGGLAANLAACLWFRAAGTQILPLLLLGLLASGAAVATRPRSALVLGVAAVSAWFARLGFGAWDSAQLLSGVLAAVAAFAAVIVLLPRALQRTVVSVMIVLHFVGILTAVSSVPPTPALMNWAWTYFYRPYLQFMYLNNAYHFYSPEPGPGILVWFYVRYDDGTADWYKIPNRSQNPLTQEYQRRLSLAESVNQLLPVSSVSTEIYERRVAAWRRDGIPLYPLAVMDVNMQHREPNPYSKDMTRTYVRFVSHLEERETGKRVAAVKVYRVVHNLPTPKEIAAGVDPTEKNFYYPYYQGEFTPDGHLKNDQDPYLYWVIPIVKTQDPAAFRAGRLRLDQPQPQTGLQIVDLLEEHVLLPTETTADPKLDPIPGGPAVPNSQKSASLSAPR
jgi:hypothetical protein